MICRLAIDSSTSNDQLEIKTHFFQEKKTRQHIFIVEVYAIVWFIVNVQFLINFSELGLFMTFFFFFQKKSCFFHLCFKMIFGFISYESVSVLVYVRKTDTYMYYHICKCVYIKIQSVLELIFLLSRIKCLNLV